MGDTVSTGIDAITDNRTYYNCPRCGSRVWAYGAFVGSPCIDGCSTTTTSQASMQSAQQYADDLREERKTKVEKLTKKLETQKTSQQNQVDKIKSDEFDQDYWDKDRKTRNENNPFYQFKALDMKNTMTNICDEINQNGRIADGINKCMDNIEENLKKALDADVKLFEDGIAQYRKFADDIKLSFVGSYGAFDTEVKNDEDYANDSDADEDDCIQDHLNEFPKQLKGLSNSIKNAKEACKGILRDYRVFIKACEDAEKKLDTQMNEIPASMINIANNLKELHMVTGMKTKTATGAVIGGVGGAVVGGLAGAIGGVPGAMFGAVLGTFLGAVIGGLVGHCIRDIKKEKIDRSKTRDALEKLARGIQKMLNDRALEYKKKKVVAESDKETVKKKNKGIK